VLERNPDYAEAWSYLGNLLDEERDAGGAIAAHRRARGLQPDRGIHLFNLARILAQAGREAEALAAADTLASMNDPEYSAQAALIRAPIVASRGDPAGAAALVRAFLAERPDHPMRAALESALRRWEAGPSETPGR
jgi:tetratricopeptide (TPR) repeat protein